MQVSSETAIDVLKGTTLEDLRKGIVEILACSHIEALALGSLSSDASVACGKELQETVRTVCQKAGSTFRPLPAVERPQKVEMLMPLGVSGRLFRAPLSGAATPPIVLGCRLIFCATVTLALDSLRPVSYLVLPPASSRLLSPSLIITPDPLPIKHALHVPSLSSLSPCAEYFFL